MDVYSDSQGGGGTALKEEEEEVQLRLVTRFSKATPSACASVNAHTFSFTQ